MVDDGAGGLISTTFRMPVWYRKPAEAVDERNADVRRIQLRV